MKLGDKDAISQENIYTPQKYGMGFFKKMECLKDVGMQAPKCRFDRTIPKRLHDHDTVPLVCGGGQTGETLVLDGAHGLSVDLNEYFKICGVAHREWDDDGGVVWMNTIFRTTGRAYANNDGVIRITVSPWLSPECPPCDNAAIIKIWCHGEYWNKRLEQQYDRLLLTDETKQKIAREMKNAAR